MTTPPPPVKCPFPDCEYQTAGGVAEQIASALLNIHALVHNPQSGTSSSSTTKVKAPRMDRPLISLESTAEDWLIFVRKWDLFKKNAAIGVAEATNHLWQCCEGPLADALFKQVDDFSKVDEKTLLGIIKSLAVVHICSSVRKAKLLLSRQDHGQPIRAFATNVMGTARICSFSIKCSNVDCNQINDYTPDIVKHVVISGISDDEIRKDILSIVDLDEKSLDETIAVIESKEMASRMLSPAIASHGAAINSNPTSSNQGGAQDPRINMITKCQSCGKAIKKFKKWFNKYSQTTTMKEFKQCPACWKLERAQKDRHAGTPSPATNVAALSQPSLSPTLSNQSSSVKTRHSISLDHYIFDGTAGWSKKASKSQPTVRLCVSTNSADYNHLDLPCPNICQGIVDAIADTGAQSSLMGMPIFQRCGFSPSNLIPVTKRMYAANEEHIHILGAVFIRLSGMSHYGAQKEAAEMVYVTDSTNLFYISRHAMEQLGIISTDFPQIGAASISHSISEPLESVKGRSCSCSPRQSPPSRPVKLPFSPCEANNGKMRQWLLDRFSSSTFNKCRHQRLPKMSGPPIAIHIQPGVKPTAVHSPAPIPLHWKEQVKKQLDADVELGVIEKVGPGNPTTWCHRAIWVRKADGTPRRVVDLQPLNKHCSRETHHTVPPFQQARSIPPNTFRSVTDAWNGYHSVPVRESDRELLTFITEFGRYRYCVAPQGYVASGDGYTHRYDRIIADIPRKTKCVDDAVLWDTDLETHWWRMIDYLELVGREGIILNPSKFQFASKHIEFAGFDITDNDVRPLPKYLDAITGFPRPRNIKDVRAWFGLVNQVAHYGKLVEIMAPFKALLSPKTPFCWTDELDDSFTRSKTELMDAIKNGVQIFDPTRRTCLNPDWSTLGIGYWLRQKYCDCDSATPDCCPRGWKITLAGSRFLHGSEKRYAAVEGEALALAWSLEDTKFFTMGCDDLVIATDHKPLVKLFGDRSLDDIANSRIFRLKQRTLSWRFRVVHVAGTSIPAADTISRYPTSSTISNQEWAPFTPGDCTMACHDRLDQVEACVIASMKASLNAIKIVSWGEVRNATASDVNLCTLQNFIVGGFPSDSTDIPFDIRPYWQYRDNLSIIDGVVMYNDRIVVPVALRGRICQVLHAAHQGTNAMRQRAQATVFWPGITSCIDRTRAVCTICCRTAPSQPYLPPAEPFVPTYPFQAIAADYCTVAGQHYLVAVDRFSNWPEVVHVRPGSVEAGALGLQDLLRRYFQTFGVVEELSSDGGPEFTAHSTQDFLRRWGVRHRLSSVGFARSNGRAEICVKAMKRLIQGNVPQDGKTSTDAFTRALLQYRNCPDPSTGVSPAEIVFGHPLNDALPRNPTSQIFDNGEVRPLWRNLWRDRERALRARLTKQTEALTQKTKDLTPLSEGDICRIQNQSGRFPLRWDKTGTVMQCNANDQYLVKVDGSHRLTLRNRKFLRKIEPFHRPTLVHPPRPVLAPHALTPGPEVTAPAVVNPSPTPVEPIVSPMEPRGADKSVDLSLSPCSPRMMVTTPIVPGSIRRSTRTRQPPQWHEDYHIGTLTLGQ